MKKISFLCMLLAALSFLSCESSNPYVNPGDVEDPKWQVVDGTDMSSSMTAIVKVSFTEKQGTLAAFIGDSCYGVSKAEDYVEGLYYLYISGPSTVVENPQVTLKFYSPDLKRIFVAKEKFTYANDGTLGTYSSPYTPEWTVDKQ